MMKTNPRGLWLAALLIVYCFGFMSCSKDDNEDLIGTWEATHMTGWLKKDGKIIESESWNDDSGADDFFEKGGTMTFKKGGAWTHNSYGIEGTWSLKNNTLSIYSDEGFDREDSVTFNVLNLTSSELTLTLSGPDGDYEYYYEWTFKKI